MKNFISIGLLLILTACAQPKQADAVLPASLFSINQFLADQVLYLEQEDPTVVKTALTTDGTTEVKTITGVSWQKELELFQEIDLSKPALAGVYEVSDSVSGPFLVKTYQKRPDEDALVQRLIVKKDTISGDSYINALMEQDNLLYFSRKILSMHIAMPMQKPVILSYEVSGTQKIILADTLIYQVQSKINWQK